MSDDETSNDEVLNRLEEIRDAVADDPELRSTPPREAFDLWMESSSDKADATLQSYKYRVDDLLEFFEREGITDLADVTTRDIKYFEVQRKANPDVGKQYQNTQFGTINQFLAFCEEMDAVTPDVASALTVPGLSKDDRVNTEKLVTERAESILDDLETFQYASRDHALMLLLWRTTARIGTLHALDLDDCYLNAEDKSRIRADLKAEGYLDEVIDEILGDVELPFLWPQHQPDEGTPLKNKEGGERVINIADWVGDVLQAYINVNRADVVDDDGREPLLTSKQSGGRLSKSAIRNSTYILTQPCEFGGECPHDRDPETCEAREHGYGSKCPSSRSPHKLRTGAITNHRDRGWPVSELSDKANTSEELIAGVYDQPEQLVRGSYRRKLLDKMGGN